MHFQPFDPVHKRTEATVKDADGKAVQGDQGRAAGDFGIVVPMPTQVKSAVDKAVNDFAARGFRSLGVARAAATVLGS